MKTLATYLALILTGFLLHKGIYEYSNMRQINAYNQCQKDNPQNPRKYDECNITLRPTKLEALLFYQPNFWCKKSPFGCDVEEDRD